MAVVTNHQNQEVDITLQDIEVVVELDAAIGEQIDGLIEDIGSPKVDIFSSLIDNDDGTKGRISKLIGLYKKELDNLIADKKIDKEQYGLAIIELLKMSTDYAYKSTEYADSRKDADANAISKLLQMKIDMLRLSADAQKAVYEAEDIRYKTAIFNPLTRETMKEEIIKRHIEHQTQEFNLTNMLPIEKDKLLAETNLLNFDLNSMKPQELLEIKEKVLASIADRKAKEYYQTVIQPIEMDKVRAETDLLKFDLNSMRPQQLLDMKEKVLASIADRKVKEYYQLNIQPCEKRLTCAKATIEEINAGVGGGTSLPTAKLAQIAVQTDLYQAEINAYEDRRRQKLLETIVNYHSMIFPDLPLPEAFDWAVNTANSKALYNLLKA